MSRMHSFIAAVLLLFVVTKVLLAGARMEAAFEAGLIVGAGMTLAHRPR